ncbi:hypothetical protein J4419_01445 [Candidatus Woesearchaeota archaeon]|nr:hypothetical protein [Candidatus Woesearchaeota archaeon]
MKKATLWFTMSAIGLVIGILAFRYYLSLSLDLQKPHYFPDLLEESAKADYQKSSFSAYLAQAAKVSASEVAYILASRGGFAGEAPCGLYQGAAVWQSSTKKLENCRPDFKKELSVGLSERLSPSLKRFGLLPSELPLSLSTSREVTISGVATRQFILPEPPEQKPEFDAYVLTAYANVKCDDVSLNRDFDVKMSDTYSTSGAQHLFADLVLNENSATHTSFYKETNPHGIVEEQFIGTQISEYCPALKVNKVYNLELATIKEGEETCKVSTLREGGDFEGSDLVTWGYNTDANKDGKEDESCADSPTYLECPGVRAFFCGTTGYVSLTSNPLRFPLWEPIESNNEYAEQTFVRVWQGDEPKEARPFESYLHAKTTVMFSVDFEPSLTAASQSTTRESFWGGYEYHGFAGGARAPSEQHVMKLYRPSFAVLLPYDASDYEKISDAVGTLTAACEQNEDAHACTSEQMGELSKDGLTWTLEPAPTEGAEERTVVLRVASSQTLFPRREPLAYRVAVYLPLSPQLSETFIN